MNIPLTRSEFEHRLHLLENHSKTGRLMLVEGVSGESLLKVRRLPNGRIDFLSVDETARLQANMMEWVKSIPMPNMPNMPNDEGTP
ncbi:hypothetical protein P4B29_06525 [Citrobacter freundii]|uniref:AVAST type 1 anti-phage system protein Avs1c n=1 Tax=Citrobacter TaxID=544 RepID=UPI00110E4F44|nr:MULTISPECIES: AVAST type 1 anti-phage system protein Avs1c [Citrobacter]MBP8542971.1 hypothetical protein [Citrobacter sp. On2M]MBW5273718.1 hypothetical protein [Citrobacter sp. On28M]MDF5764996.1 hypothetical protein [Citrobacter freundii]QCW56259.1 hypothetical protein FGF61_19465 [Citrobacter freundii]